MGIESILGELPKGWETTTLGEICQRGGGSIQTGPFGSQLHASDYVEVGIPSIMPQNIGDNHVNPDGIARITEQDAKRLGRYLVRKGDIVYSRRGDVERRALITEKEDGWLCGTGSLRVRLGSFDHVDPIYASYYLGDLAVREWIVRHAVGATMPNLNTAILSALPFVLPPLQEQRTIAEILGALDDKIEVNRHMNATLESMARAVFRQWFVENDEVGDWEIKRIGEITERVGMGPFGSSIKVDTFVDEGIPVINGQQLRGFMLSDSGFNFVSLEHAEKLKNANVYPGDIVLTHRGTLGQVSLIPYDAKYKRYIVSQSQFFVRCNLEKLTPNYLIYYLRSPEGQHRLLANRSAVGVPAIAQPVTYLRSVEIAVPPKETLDAFEQIVTPLHRKYSANRRESRTLGSLRDSLLPKLMRGEVRVKEIN